MFPEYHRALMQSVAALAAVTAHALSTIIPSGLAAVIGVFVAIVYGQQNDEVSKTFKTDVERVLGPTPDAMNLAEQCVLFGLAAALVTANVFPAAIAALVGLGCMAFAITKMLK